MRVVIVAVGDRGRARSAAKAREPADRFSRLPAPVRVEDMVSTKEASPTPDPTRGRDVERDFMLRYAGVL